jgi:tetratricopeptide (TPR) repeat protein
MPYKKLAVITIIACSIACVAQQISNNNSVIKMHVAGLSDDIIVSSINSEPGAYDTTPDGLIALKAVGISDKVIAAILGKSSSTTVTQAPVATLPASTRSQPRVLFLSQGHGDGFNAMRDQSMEMSEDFQESCSMVLVSVNENEADYTVLLNHIEVGVARENQIEVANKNGDIIAGPRDGGSIESGTKWLCNFIIADWYTRTAKRNALGQGVPQNYDQAIFWYRKAVDLGHPGAEYSLGSLYANGQGVPQDYSQAAHLYREAAEQDDAEAQYSLAILLHSGQGLPVDKSEAYFWMCIASGSGTLNVDEQEQALKYRDQYEGELSKPAFEKVRKQIHKWTKSLTTVR